MKTKNLFKVAFVIILATMASCASQMRIMPKAVNTVNTIHFDELNLERGHYIVSNTITTDASIVYVSTAKHVNIRESQNEFELNFVQGKVINPLDPNSGLTLYNFEGVLRLGYLTNDDANGAAINYLNPEDLARRLAIYRLINLAKEQGADGVIEPVVSTNIEQQGKMLVFTTTVSAKCVKIKANSK